MSGRERATVAQPGASPGAASRAPRPASPVPRHLPQLQPQGLQLVSEAHELLLAAAAATGLRPVPPLLGQGPARRPLVPLALGLGFPAAAPRPALRGLLSGHGRGPAACSGRRKSRRTAGRPTQVRRRRSEAGNEAQRRRRGHRACADAGTAVTCWNPAPSARRDGQAS